MSVIVAAAQASQSLPTCLGAILEQDYAGDVEVVVAAADDESRDSASAFNVLVVDNPKGTTPAGLNSAIRASRGDIIVRVDSNSIVPPDYITAVVGLLATTSAQVVGGMQVPVGRTFWEKAIAKAMQSPVGAGGARYRTGAGTAGPVDTVYLGSFERSTIEEFGGFDETFLRNQDYELNFRVRAAGGIVWLDPALQVSYRPRPSLAALASQYFQYGQWKRFFAARYPNSLRPRQVAPVLLVLGMAASTIVGAFWSPAFLIPLLYAVLLLIAGAVAVPSSGAASLGVPPALLTIHLAWGTGFLFGHTNGA